MVFAGCSAQIRRIGATCLLVALGACTPAPACRPSAPPGAAAAPSAAVTAPRESDSRWKPARPKLALGRNHTCMLRAQGMVYCWGSNTQGQLGSGTLLTSSKPKPVVAPKGARPGVLLDRVVDIASGDDHVCAVRDSGEVYCWGAARRPSETTPAPWPVRIVELRDVLGVAARGNATCAWVRDGSVYCWRLGPRDARVLPARIAGVRADEVALGAWQTCARDRAGVVFCWSDGEPRRVSGIGPVRSLGMGSTQSCALLEDGRAFCWDVEPVGVRNEVQVGPCREVTEFGRATALAGGEGSMCALFASGRVDCLPTRPLKNDFGNRSDDLRFEPRRERPLDGALALGLGHHHACVLLRDERAQCYGINESCEVGHSEVVKDEAQPVCRVELGGATDVGVGAGYSCALVKDGSVRCWGRNAGFWPPTVGWRSLRPREVVGLGKASKLAIEGATTCVLARDRTARCIVFEEVNNEYQSIHAAVPRSAVGVAGLSDLVELAVGGFSLGEEHTSFDTLGGRVCGLRRSGEVLCRWLASTPDEPPPSAADAIVIPQRAASLAIGAKEICLRTAEGRVICYGGRDGRRLAPRQVARLGQVTELGSGMDYGCAVERGRIRCWGYDDTWLAVPDESGCFGPAGSRIVEVPNLADVKQVALATHTTCALRANGSVSCWGRCPGNPAFIDVAGAKKIAIEEGRGCALVSDGAVECWGTNFFGECGSDFNREAMIEWK